MHPVLRLWSRVCSKYEPRQQESCMLAIQTVATPFGNNSATLCIGIRLEPICGQSRPSLYVRSRECINVRNICENSSVGQSAVLITPRSLVRFHLLAPSESARRILGIKTRDSEEAIRNHEFESLYPNQSIPLKKEGYNLLIKLNTIQDVNDFTELMRAVDGEAIAAQGNYRVDAKSILGIFSLDLMKPIDVNVNLKELVRFQVK